jgi:hypothetical protein
VGYARGDCMLTLIFNPWVWLAAILVIGGSNAATAFYTWGAAKDDCIAEEARDVAVAQIASEEAAKAIAKIEVKNTTIRQTLETQVREKTVFRDCRSGPDPVRLLNTTEGVAQPASGPGKLP